MRKGIDVRYIPLKQSYIYEINTRVFCKTNHWKIKDFYKNDFLELPEVKAANYIWLMGVWQPSKASIEISQKHEGLQKEFKNVLGDLKQEDIIGSPYSIYEYEPNPELAKDIQEIAEFREKLNGSGKKLILDFVPNHMSVDTILLEKYGDAFLKKETPETCKNSFLHKNGNVYYHGRDPYFDGWTDTVQWDFSNPQVLEIHTNILLKIAEICDGVRCDMAMLTIDDVFQKTHGKKALPYWTKLIPKIKSKHKDFLFIAEVYWEMEYYLQQMGFHYTYDKELYDRFKQKDASKIKGHLQAELNYQEKSLRFIENHDEERAYHIFQESSKDLFSLLTFIPGLILYHDSQIIGAEIKLPVQLGRKQKEYKEDIDLFYKRCFNRIVERRNYDLKLCQSELRPYNQEDLSNTIVYVLLQLDSTQESHSLEIFIFNPLPREIVGCFALSGDILENIIQKNKQKLRLWDIVSDNYYTYRLEDVSKHGIYIKLKPFKSHWFIL